MLNRIHTKHCFIGGQATAYRAAPIIILLLSTIRLSSRILQLGGSDRLKVMLA